MGIGSRVMFVLTSIPFWIGLAGAQTPAAISSSYESAARRESPRFAGFAAQRGEQLFQTVHDGDWSCASCHTANPLAPGKHAKTGKAIAPLAPAANPERFTSLTTADKWFKRNCNDVIGRECTAQEKGDVLAYLTQLGTGSKP
jgi:mono/diheme cytochrome c family protein